MTIEEAKARLTIPMIWARLGLPGDCRKNPCKSPFREDKHGSFSVSKCGRFFNDFGTSEAGNVVDFLRLATGLSPEAAFTKFLEMAGGGVTIAALPKREQAPKETQPRQKPVFPDFERGTKAELETLAALRHISFAACFIASGAGLLHFATLNGHRAFVLTDDARLAAQARRLDGQGWEHKDGAKAWTLYQSWGKWPLGLGTGAAYPVFMLCEGVDFLAGIHFIHAAGAETLVFPLAQLGASMAIHEDALPILAGKRVRIFPHMDEAGTKAANRWAAQLEAVGAEVDCFSFEGLRRADGSPVGDLNDATQIHKEDAHELEGLLP